MVMEDVLKTRMYLFIVFMMGTVISAQNTTAELFTNGGKMSVGSTATLSTAYNFSNLETAELFSDGDVYYYRDFHNDGVYAITTKKNTGSTVFSRLSNNPGKQLISGDGLSSFYNVVFDNEQNTVAFDLKNNMDIAGQANFKQGIVKVDSDINPKTKVSKGIISFLAGSSIINANDKSYIEGLMEKVGNSEFSFPIGDGGLYRHSSISGAEDAIYSSNDKSKTTNEIYKTTSKQNNDAYIAKYVLDDNQFFIDRSIQSGAIKLLDNKEYWFVDKGGKSVDDIVLTLSWDPRTTPADLLTHPEKDLHIVRWDELQKIWVDEGGVVDVDKREIKTPIVLRYYGYFTLATIKPEWLDQGDIMIYNLVSPNGDEVNDYFVIENIERFPNNSVQIFNRWGVKVYDTTNYDYSGNGTNNVFRGHSQGRATLSKNELLPTGTYFYIVKYEYKDAHGSRTITKTGYLHLDTN